MQPTKWIRFKNLVARTCVILASFALLTACGGGGGGGGFDSDPVGGSGPANDPVIPPPPPGGSGGSGSGGSGSGGSGSGGSGSGGSGSGGSGSGGSGSGGSDSGGSNPPPVTAPADPGPMPSYTGHDNVHAMVTTNVGDTYAIDSLGQVKRKTASDPDFLLVGNPGVPNIKGMAWNPAGFLYVVMDGAAGDDQLGVIDMSTWSMTPVGAITGHTGIESLAFDPSAARLYAVDTTADQLLLVDAGSGAPTVLGALGAGFGEVRGLAIERATQTLYAIDALTHKVAELNTSTGEAAERQTVEAHGFEGFAYDGTTDMFFGSAPGSSTIHELDVKGVQIDFAAVLGLAMNESAGKLYGSHVATARLVEIDPTTKWKRVIGYMGLPMVEGLAYDNASSTLYGVSSTAQQVYSLSTTDGSVLTTQSIVGTGGPWVNLSGLAHNGSSLVAVDTDTADMVQIDPMSGLATLLGTLSGFGSLQSLAWDATNNTWMSYDDMAQRDVIIASDATTAVFGSATGLGVISGLAWTGVGPKLLGTAAPANDLVTVFDLTPPTLSHSDVTAIGYDAGRPLLLGVDSVTDEIVQIDHGTQTSATVNTLPGTEIHALAFNPNLGIFYMVDNITETLMSTADGSSVNSVGLPGAVAMDGIRALAYDATNDRLFGVNTDTDELVGISPITGLALPVNPGQALGFDAIEGIAWDSARGQLVGVDRATGHFVTIDTVTGIATQVSLQPVGTDVASLAYDDQTDVMLAVDVATDRVIRLDPSDGTVLP